MALPTTRQASFVLGVQVKVLEPTNGGLKVTGRVRVRDCPEVAPGPFQRSLCTGRWPITGGANDCGSLPVGTGVIA